MARPQHLINEFHKGDLLSARVVGLDAALAALTTGITDAEEYADDLIEVEIIRANAAYDAAGAAAAAQAASQPLDSDLTAIAALSTTSFGRALLALADAAAGRTAFGLGTAATHATGDYDAAGSASTALTTAETYTDTSIASEVTRANAAYDASGAAAAAQAASQPLDADLTAIAALTTTAFGRGLLDDADAAAGRTSLGLGTAATHATGDYDAAGAAAAAQAASQPLDSDLTAIAALSTTSYGRSLLAGADAAALRTLLALGTAAVAATGDFDAAGAAAAAQAASQPLDSDLTAFAALAIAADKLPYGSGSHALSLADFTAAGRALVDDADAAAQRTTLGLGTAATHATGDYQAADATLTALAGLATGADKLAYSDGTDSFVQTAFTAAGRALIDDADAAAQRTTLGLGTAAVAATGDFRGATADHTHASTGAQAGQIAYSALTGTPAAERAAATAAPAAIGTAAVGTGVKDARDDHVHATGAGTPTTSAFADAAATGTGPAAAMTDHVHGRESLGTTPSTQAFGDAAAGGSATTPSKNDHKHAMPSLGTTPTTSAFGDAAAGGSATTASKNDHVHGREALGTTPSTQAFSDAAAGGSATTASKNDHKHAWPALGTSAAAVGTSAGGSATTPSKSDHVHATGAGTPSTQAIADAAAVGTGPAAAMTDHKHAMPSAQATANAGSATSMPGSPTTNDRCFRTDLGMEFVYDGTRWLSDTLFTHMLKMGPWPTPLGATEASVMDAPAPVTPGSDIYLVNLYTQFLVSSGGTALSNLHKWVQTWVKRPTGNSETTVTTVTIASGASSAWRTDTTAINALMNNGTVHYALGHTWTKTGTPGTLYWLQYVTYRIVAT